MAARLLGVYLMGLHVLRRGDAAGHHRLLGRRYPPRPLHLLAGCCCCLLLISLFVLALSCLLGWVVAKVSLKLKNKSFVTVVRCR